MNILIKNNKLISLLVIFIIIFVIGIIIISNIHQNQEDNQSVLKIDNFSNLYHNVDQNTTNDIFNLLYNTVAKNLNGNTPPQNGAVIRSSSPFLYQYYYDFGLYRGDFIVDIPNIQQSYRVIFFQNNKDSTNTINIGYRMLILCLTKSPTIYPDFNCHDLAPNDITEDIL